MTVTLSLTRTLCGLQLSLLEKEHQLEKDSLIMRYVQAEHGNNELMERLQKVESKLCDWTKERDIALGKWKALKEEKAKLCDLCDSKVEKHSLLILSCGSK